MTLDDDTLRRLLAALQHGPVSLRGGDCSGDSRAVNAFVELIAAAPALAAEVLRLRGLIAERCAAVETGPVRRRIPGCQTVGPCAYCDDPEQEVGVP